jgi:hypothetical protein
MTGMEALRQPVQVCESGVETGDFGFVMRERLEI